MPFETTTHKGLAVTLRGPRIDDVAILCGFINTLSRERTYLVIQDVEISLEAEQQYVERMLKQIEQRQRVQVLAFAGNQLIGNTEITLSDGAADHVGELGIAVAQPYRGQGVGEVLMRAVHDEAVARLPGLKLVTLTVFGNNPAAISLYRKLGYTEYGRLPGGFRHRDQYVERVYMVRTAP